MAATGPDSRAFFAERAATWEDRFPDDAPAYARAVAELDVPVGGRVLDVACGTGRGLVPPKTATSPWPTWPAGRPDQ